MTQLMNHHYTDVNEFYEELSFGNFIQDLRLNKFYDDENASDLT